ncbi:MAG: ZIP family metal transporter [Bacteroidota bacterium]|nr:ZIP family metal transporter [Bacteroidota bacterium]
MTLGIILILLLLSPLTGGVLAWFLNGGRHSQVKIFLSFSGAYLFTVSVTSLMPEVYKDGTMLTGLLVLAGFMFQILLEQFTKGVEHGHLHQHQGKGLRPVLQVFIGMSLHAFLEGMPIGDAGFIQKGISQKLLPGTCLHEIPAAFALGSVMLAAGFRGFAFWAVVIPYAFMLPAGALISGLLNSAGMEQWVHTYLLPFVIGAFLHISTTILYENSENHTYKRLRLVAVLAGVLVATASLVL